MPMSRKRKKKRDPRLVPADRRVISESLKRGGRDTAIRTAMVLLEQRGEAQEQRRAKMIADETDHAWPPNWISTPVKLPPSEKG